MESIRLPYKNDDFGNPIFARVSWSNDAGDAPKPIALIMHAGGFMVGSSEVIPPPQIQHLAAANFLVVAPNYRLAPQVPASAAFTDIDDAHDWATQRLAQALRATHPALTMDATRTVAAGHSAGGTLALHLAAQAHRGLRAATAFYPSLYLSDPATTALLPSSVPPFGAAPDFRPTEAEWALVSPPGQQLSEAPFVVPGAPPPPRTRWQMHILKHGEWLAQAQPDGAYGLLDPVGGGGGSRSWGEETRAAVMFVQGEADVVPGSGLELVRRAEKELKAKGVREVEVEVVPGEGHMFDLPPMVGTSDLGPRWEAVVKGLEWLKSHV